MFHSEDQTSAKGPSVSRRNVLIGLTASLLAIGAFLAIYFAEKPNKAGRPKASAAPGVAADKIVKSEAEWRKILTREQYSILRQEGTESPYNNRYNDHHGKGTYACVACGNRLFLSSAKFESGTGWPSFFQPIDATALGQRTDYGLNSRRTEVICRRCEGHLGHVFPDGPRPTGLRYCMNSAAMTFFPEKVATPK